MPYILFLAIFLSVGLIVECATPYDSTDDFENKTRSGLSLYTDHLTGCQYLSTKLIGNLTPRVNGQGKHVGCNNDKQR